MASKHRWIMASLLTVGCLGKESPDGDPNCDGAAIICTIAGTGDAGYNSQGIQALDTKLDNPTAVDFGRDGQLLINDSKNFLVRRLDGDDVLESVVGKVSGTYAQEGEAIKSPLNMVVDMDVGPDGMLYLVESLGQQVLRVNLEQPVPSLEIIAGTQGVEDYDDEDVPALEGHFGTLSGITVGSDGTVYVSDSMFGLIRAITPDGILTNIAGMGDDGLPIIIDDASDRFDSPRKMDLKDGILYVADTNRHRIAAIDLADGQVWDHIGTADLPGYMGDGGPATDAILESPYSVDFGPGGQMTIADSGNHAIRVVLGSGRIETVVGRGPSGYAGDEGPAETSSLAFPHDVAYAPDGDLIIADTNNNVIRRVNQPNW